MRNLIALLSDFGHADPYVGVMKGVILGLAPKATLVDLCHGIPPRDVRAGAFVLRTSVPFFPKGTLFIAVVDPGVGSKRRLLWARTATHSFLAPDNGLLSGLPLVEVRELTNRKLWLPEVSATFHGRDVLAPVAGRLARGLSAPTVGPRVRDWKKLPRDGSRVLMIDRFGNAITGLTRRDVGSVVRFRGKRIALAGHYAAVPDGKAVALFGSSGHLELSIRNGDFARRHRARPGDSVYAGR